MKAHEHLAKWRREQNGGQGISQAAAAAQAGVRTATWCDWENGKKIPQLDLAIRLQTLTNGRVTVGQWGEVAAERRADKERDDEPAPDSTSRPSRPAKGVA